MYKLSAFNPSMLRKMVVWCSLAVVIGAFSGLASTLFFNSVNWAIEFRRAHTWLILFLPVAGFFVALFYKTYGSGVENGNNLILDEIHDPKKIIPFRMVPMIFIGAVISHLFGASVGREGGAVQMGAGISDQFSKYLDKFFTNRKLILMMGMSAGFASIFGTPIAGAIFGFEVLFIGTLVYDALLPCLVAAISGYYTALLLGVVHPHYFYLEVPNISVIGLLSAVVAGIIFGYAAKFFVWSIHKVKDLYKVYIPNNLYHPIIGGMIVMVSFYAIGSDRYHNLGEEIIHASFTQHVYPWDFLGKIFMTSVSLGSGFKGGEVMSLFYIGSTLGNSLSYILPLDYPVLAALGFVAVFAGAANVPIASVILAFELFGPGIGAYAALAVVSSYLFSGGHGIYHSQRTHLEKNI
ncbi:MAG: chloride channel protein [Rhizobacter sp.]|nr:chloride channel protein [Bacteriovorax sp.]